MKVISLGLGVQSTALYYMSSMGEIPRADFAIFADPGKEKTGTLKYLKFLQTWAVINNGIPIIVERKKNLYRDLLVSENSTGQRFSSIPAYTKDENNSVGMLRRQCTREYKIDQVDKAIRRLLGVPRIINQKVHVLQGITIDEIDRMTIPNVGWKINVYPFCNYAISKTLTQKIEGNRKSRNDLISWYNEHELPIPQKSSCVFCPYQSDAAWFEMKEKAPSDFAAAVKVDEAIRDSTKKGIKQKAFLHSTCKPLSQIEFSKGNPDLWHGECSGNCHI